MDSFLSSASSFLPYLTIGMIAISAVAALYFYFSKEKKDNKASNNNKNHENEEGESLEENIDLEKTKSAASSVQQTNGDFLENEIKKEAERQRQLDQQMKQIGVAGANPVDLYSPKEPKDQNVERSAKATNNQQQQPMAMQSSI